MHRYQPTVLCAQPLSSRRKRPCQPAGPPPDTLISWPGIFYWEYVDAFTIEVSDEHEADAASAEQITRMQGVFWKIGTLHDSPIWRQEWAEGPNSLELFMWVGNKRDTLHPHPNTTTQPASSTYHSHTSQPIHTTQASGRLVRVAAHRRRPREQRRAERLRVDAVPRARRPPAVRCAGKQALRRLGGFGPRHLFQNLT